MLKQLFELRRNDDMVGVGDVELNGHRVARKEVTGTPQLVVDNQVEPPVAGGLPGQVDRDALDFAGNANTGTLMRKQRYQENLSREGGTVRSKLVSSSHLR